MKRESEGGRRRTRGRKKWYTLFNGVGTSFEGLDWGGEEQRFLETYRLSDHAVQFLGSVK